MISADGDFGLKRKSSTASKQDRASCVTETATVARKLRHGDGRFGGRKTKSKSSTDQGRPANHKRDIGDHCLDGDMFSRSRWSASIPSFTFRVYSRLSMPSGGAGLRSLPLADLNEQSAFRHGARTTTAGTAKADPRQPHITSKANLISGIVSIYSSDVHGFNERNGIFSRRCRVHIPGMGSSKDWQKRGRAEAASGLWIFLTRSSNAQSIFCH